MDKKQCTVSLTSHQKRFSTLPLCLESLFHQTFSYDRIILYLDDNEDLKQLPNEIRHFEDRGLKIIKTDDALGCHTKYFYAMSDFPNDIIITVDDDVMYSPVCLEKLYSSYLRYPKAVSANRVHRISLNEEGSIKPYLEWDFEYDANLEPAMNLFATGVGGVLYPPHILPQLAFDRKLIKKYCLYADDIWLKFMEIINHVPVVYTGIRPQHPKQILGTKETGLFQYNKAHGINDLCIKEIKNFLKEMKYIQEG